MTLAARNVSFIIAIAVCGLLLIGFVGIGAELQRDDLLSTLPQSTVDAKVLFWDWQASSDTPIDSALLAGIIGLISLVGLIVTARVFRRVGSPEIYFIALFLFAMALDQCRIIQLSLLIHRLPSAYGMLTTRIVEFGHILGLLALFVSSIYATGVEYPKTGSLTAMLFALAFALVYFAPVDSVALTPTLLYAIGTGSRFQIVSVVIALFTIVNYAYAIARGPREDSMPVAVAVMAMVVGRELIYLVPAPASFVVGGILVAGGLGLYLGMNRSNYLWN